MTGDIKSKISGDDNKVIQGLTAGRDIIIKIADDLPPEVKKQKQTLSTRIEELVSKLTDLKKSADKSNNSVDKIEIPDNPEYQEIKWRRLVQAIKHQGCVLFIGPEVSVNEKGISLHEIFYKELVDKSDDVKYMKEEGFFSPRSDEDIFYDVLEFYKDKFKEKNIIGRNILEKFAQIPFSLIISLCPDDTIHDIFNDFDMKHQYLYYEAEKKKEVDMPDNENPIIYNILGSAAENGRYIYTHENLYKYLKENSTPSEIKKKIKDATHYLFIGFDFNKWYNRLLLFVLGVEYKPIGKDRLNIENKETDKEFKNFIKKQFSITSIHDDYDEFIEWLIQNARQEEGLVKDLSQSFIQTNFSTLRKLSTRVSDEKKLEELLKINDDTDSIDNKIESFKKLIS